MNTKTKTFKIKIFLSIIFKKLHFFQKNFPLIFVNTNSQSIADLKINFYHEKYGYQQLGNDRGNDRRSWSWSPITGFVKTDREVIMAHKLAKWSLVIVVHKKYDRSYLRIFKWYFFRKKSPVSSKKILTLALPCPLH